MITYIPEDCHDEYETVYGRSLEIKQKTFFCCNRMRIYRRISYIKIRRYMNNRMMVLINFIDDDKPEILLTDVLQIDVYHYNLL